jgi:(R,R)-butanediol dehydrogenase/meso-butanediol dehydrogenase/diacetyl reductase
MPTMKSVQTAAPGTVEVAEIERPVPGPRDVLMRVRACGICGTDAAFVQMGGMPAGPEGQTAAIPLGHEPAGQRPEAGAEVASLKAGDRVVVNPQAAPSSTIGRGGPLGGMSEYLLIANAAADHSVAVFPDTLPVEVAALNEPTAVARHCVNCSQARTSDKVVVFGAGPIGLGAVMWLKLRGVGHVAVADVIPGRLRTALAAGADAVIDSSREDVTTRLTGLHGQSTNALGAASPDTDIYIDAAGAAIVVNTALRAAKWGARPVTVAVHKQPEPIDLGATLRSEMTIIASQGYPSAVAQRTVAAGIAGEDQRPVRRVPRRAQAAGQRVAAQPAPLLYHAPDRGRLRPAVRAAAGRPLLRLHDRAVHEPSGIASGGRETAGRLLSGGPQLPRAAG